MATPEGPYGDLIRIGASTTEVLKRVPLTVSATDGSMDERTLRDLLFEHPQSLPISAIDASYANLVPVCTELSTPAGKLDAVYVNPQGRLTLAEFKLWRNPQARREVIGQILDYAKELADWGYEDLQREVSRRLGRPGNVLYELARHSDESAEEAQFVDNVERCLGRGDFLLLIVGDGIREGVGKIVDFVQRYSGLRFRLALVEAAIYRDGSDQIIVQPRILTRTEVVQRIVVESQSPHGPGEDEAEEDVGETDLQRENTRFWTAVLDGYSFADVTVDVPVAGNDSLINVRVRNSGFGGWALSFGAFLLRGSSPLLGVYLTCRKGFPKEARIHERLRGQVDDLRREAGGELKVWTNPKGRPRIGFQKETALPFDPDGVEFDRAAQWMRDHLDRLVSTLHPRLQRILLDSD